MNYNYDFKATQDAKESGKFLSAGIHDVTFKGISLDKITSQKDNNTYKTMKLTVDVDDYGEYTHNFFEPTSDQRTESQFGTNPSQVEQFMIAIRQILEAVCPDTLNNIYASKKGLGSTFEEIVNNVIKCTAPKVGTRTQIKLIPNGSYNQIPGFPARITKDGNLGIATRFIGENLVLSASELKKVEAAKNAKPTDMKSVQNQATKDLLNDLNMEMDEDSSDLPF